MNPENQSDTEALAACADSLVDKVDNILSTMCFIMADACEAAALEESLDGCTSSWLEFKHGTEANCVRLTATEGFLEEAASGLLGLDPEEGMTEEDGRDTLLELANVIGGEVVALLGGEDLEFEMGIPKASAPDAFASGQAAESKVAVTFDSMGELFKVEVL